MQQCTSSNVCLLPNNTGSRQGGLSQIQYDMFRHVFGSAAVHDALVLYERGAQQPEEPPKAIHEITQRSTWTVYRVQGLNFNVFCCYTHTHTHYQPHGAAGPACTHETWLIMNPKRTDRTNVVWTVFWEIGWDLWSRDARSSTSHSSIGRERILLQLKNQ